MTDMASPIGELFDHLCDSFSLTLCALIFAALARIGPHYTFIVLLAFFIPFYSSHWVDYNTGSLVMGRFGGPTDLLVMLIGALILTGSFGSSIWLQHVEIFHHQLLVNEIFVAIISLGSVISFLQYVYQVFWPTNTTSQRPHWALVLLQLFAYTVFMGLCILWRVLVPHTLFVYPHQFLIAIGLINAYLLGRLIVQRVTKEPVAHFNFALLIFLASFIVSYVDGLSRNPPMDCWVTYGLLAYGFIQWTFFFGNVVAQLSDALQIPVFTVTQEKRDKQETEKSPLLSQNESQSRSNVGSATI